MMNNDIKMNGDLHLIVFFNNIVAQLPAEGKQYNFLFDQRSKIGDL